MRVKVALVHYWLVGMRGGEKVLEALCELFPDADVFTHVYDPAAISSTIRSHRIRTTFIQRLPAAKRLYQRYLPLMPLALEQLNLQAYDLVISSESGPAKGVIPRPGAVHLCYCLTPMRYLWDMSYEYTASAGRLKGAAMRLMAHYLRTWDVTTAARVTKFVAISEFVAQRVRAYYRREAQVIHPPVDTDAFAPADRVEDFYLMVGQLVPYKRFDLAIEAFNRLKKPLLIIGQGSEFKRLSAIAGPTVTLAGYQPGSVIRDYYARCAALIFPGVEDFGIVPVEAMASGRPVIAYGRGGILDTVVEGQTGIFFHQQSTQALIDAVERFEREKRDFSPVGIARHAKRFDRAVFKERIMRVIDALVRAHQDNRPASFASRAVPVETVPDAAQV